MTLPTVRDLVARRDLGLRLLVDGPASGRGIHSVHVTDLDRPGRYLLPAELVLTNGLWHDLVPAEAWVEELRRAGVTALGYGLGTPRAAVPDGVVAACRAAQLPLVEVPEALSFATLGRVVTELTARGHERELRRQLERGRSLVAAVAGGGGYGALLAALRRDTGLDAAVVGPGGRVLAHVGAAPSAAVATAAEVAARGRTLPADVGEDVSAFVASAGRLPSSTLVVGAPLGALDDAARVVVDQVAAHTALEDARRRDELAALLPVAAELVELVRAGELPAAAIAARLRALGLPSGPPLAVVAGDHEPAVLRHALAALGLPHVVAHHEGRAVAVVAVATPELPLDALAATLRGLDEEPILGAGRPVAEPGELRRSLAEALNAATLARARPSGERTVRHVDLGSHVLLLDLLDPAVLRSFREAVLGPLEHYDATHRSELVTTLRAFLASGGRWRRTADGLHVHPNTLRHRLERVEALTGRALDRTADRVDFHLALALPAPD